MKQGLAANREDAIAEAEKIFSNSKESDLVKKINMGLIK